MKTDIHPKYHQVNVKCTCGNEFTVGSTRKEIKLDICSACHPFFTGKQKFVDTAGRVDKYFQKYGEEAQRKFKKKKKHKRFSDEEVASMEPQEGAPEPDSPDDALMESDGGDAQAEAAEPAAESAAPGQTPADQTQDS